MKQNKGSAPCRSQNQLHTRQENLPTAVIGSLHSPSTSRLYTRMVDDLPTSSLNSLRSTARPGVHILGAGDVRGIIIV